jgi:hypothetical protein
MIVSASVAGFGAAIGLLYAARVARRRAVDRWVRFTGLRCLIQSPDETEAEFKKRVKATLAKKRKCPERMKDDRQTDA